MKRNIFTLIKAHPSYFLLSLGSLVSGIGTSLTMIAIYAELSARNTPASFYSAAFILGVLPGLFTSGLTNKLSSRFKLSTILIVAELIGAASLVFPFIGLKSGLLSLLLVAEFIGSAITGLLAPFSDSIIRNNFEDQDLPLVTTYSVYSFSANFIIGQALGTILYNFIGTRIYLLLDLSSFLFAAGLIAFANRLRPHSFSLNQNGNEKIEKFKWNELTLIQKRAFLITPALAAICAPAMSILPAIGPKFGVKANIGTIIIAPSLILLLLKTLGQMLGPLLTPSKKFEHMVNNNLLLITCLLIYLIFYLIAFTTTNIIIAGASIVLAHTFSNVVFILGSFSMTRYFSSAEIEIVSARHYQVVLVVITLSALWAGYVFDHISSNSIIYISFISLIALSWFIISKPDHINILN